MIKDKREAALILYELKNSLKETGKDEPLRDAMIPIYQEACRMGMAALGYTDKEGDNADKTVLKNPAVEGAKLLLKVQVRKIREKGAELSKESSILMEMLVKIKGKHDERLDDSILDVINDIIGGSYSEDGFHTKNLDDAVNDLLNIIRS